MIQKEDTAVSDIREENNMMRIIGFCCATIFLSVLMFGCNSKLLPSGKTGKEVNNFDSVSAEFNYTYVEAIRQKLMGNYGDALKYFEQCISLYPESDASYFQMAQIFQKLEISKTQKYTH